MLSSPLMESLMHQYEASPVPFAAADEQLRILWYNEAAKDRCPSLVMGEGLESVKIVVGESQLKTLLHSGQVYHTPCLQEPLFRYSVTIIPVMDGSELIGAMITSSEAQERSSGSETLSAVFSQQIREPLFSIFSALQTLQHSLEEETVPSKRAQNSLQQINRQCYHLLRFTMNFTELIRLENGVPNSGQHHVELCSLLEKLCSALYLTALDKGIHFTFRLPEKPLYLLCDTDRLTYAILLLMANSFQFTPKGEVSLSVTAEEKVLHVAVSDNGCGIPTENLSKIYQAGYSFDPTLNMPVSAGIGLTVLRQMILSGGGTLLITSDGLGKGTLAAFDFPCESTSAIPLFYMEPLRDHFSDRFSMFHILMSGVSEPPELD